jgi:hypothetical protein
MFHSLGANAEGSAKQEPPYAHVDGWKTRVDAGPFLKCAACGSAPALFRFFVLASGLFQLSELGPGLGHFDQ